MIFTIWGGIAMNKIIAFCGIVCSECPVYTATQQDNNQDRIKIAKLWSKKYGFEITPKDVDCDGCLIKTGRLFKFCRVCNIRTCCQEQHIENCAHCSDFACNKINSIFSAVPDAKTQLQRIKDNQPL